MSETNDDKKVFRPKMMTLDDIRDGCITMADGDESETRICVVNEELRQGLGIIEQFDTSVSILGSARTPEDHVDYQMARELAGRIVTELGYAVNTGGGPGIMEAGNRGAYEAGGESIAMTIKLPMEQSGNPYITTEVPFYYFFTRKVALVFSAEAYVYFPGGFGTLDELFELLTLMQTDKVPIAPVILMGSSYWNPLHETIQKMMLDDRQTISPEDRDLYVITDSIDEAIAIIKKAPIRKSA